MVITPHALTGLALTRNIDSARKALAMGALSHLALDRIPHTDYGLSQRALLVADAALAAVLVARLSRRNRVSAWGALGGILPDLLAVSEIKLGVNVTRPAHNFAHANSNPPVVVGVGAQLATIAAALRLARR